MKSKNDCTNSNCSLYGKCNLGENCILYKGKKKANKYQAQKTEYNGEMFDSKRELNRYIELNLLLRSGEISNLRRQVKYELLPTQREPNKIGKRGGEIQGKVIEHGVSYIADFVYEDKNGNIIVEDTKGMRTKDYILKRKMMLYFHGIRIKEI